MEFLAAPVGLALLLFFVALGLRNPSGPLPALGRAGFIAAHSVVVASVCLDWGYGDSVDFVPAWGVMGMRFPAQLAVVPPTASLLVVALLAFGGRLAVWRAFLVSVPLPIMTLAALLYMERKLDISFLSVPAIAAVSLPIVGALLLVPEAGRTLPPRPSKWFSVVYGGRLALMEGLERLASRRDLSFSPPVSVLDAGSVTGSIDGRLLRVSTVPQMWPPYYRLDMVLDRPSGEGTFKVCSRVLQGRYGCVAPAAKWRPASLDGLDAAVAGDGVPPGAREDLFRRIIEAGACVSARDGRTALTHLSTYAVPLGYGEIDAAVDLLRSLG